jgi:hypothetical protein
VEAQAGQRKYFPRIIQASADYSNKDNYPGSWISFPWIKATGYAIICMVFPVFQARNAKKCDLISGLGWIL